MATTPDPPDADPGSFPVGPETHDTPPTDDTMIFGRYRVLRELGRGGMGVVLLARDEKLGQPVAIKVVPDSVVQDADAINALRKEVLRGMALTHPGIARTNHLEQDEHGAAIVMEFIEGWTLAELMKAQPGGCFDTEQILPWIEQLVAVLDYAHDEARLAHRDLKPGNIMITAGLRVKVADFGIASALGETQGQVSIRADGSGTPQFMSPQQFSGEPGNRLDDIYSLGATIYALLTGKPPFHRGNVGQLYGQVMNAIAPPMAERRREFGVTGKVPIPETWEETVAACLSKGSAERPQSAGEVLRRLKAGVREAALRVTILPHAEEEAPPAAVVPPEVSDPAARLPYPEELPVAPPHPSAAPRRARFRWAWVPITLVLICAAVIAAVHFRDREKSNRASPANPKPPPSAPSPSKPAPNSPGTATKDAPFINSLGMEFVPVPGTSVLFCRWETRVKDCAAFAAAAKRVIEKPFFAQTDTHPAVNVSWVDARDFCRWLAQKEDREYRLPTDEEWSAAVGLPKEKGFTPKEKDSQVAGVFPWGTTWPPPKNAGNYDRGLAVDTFEKTAPIGSFAANRLGIHDLGGNVWEWCDDWYDSPNGSRVLRGGSFYYNPRDRLLSSYRNYLEPSGRGDSIGFRVVVAGASSGR